MYIIESIGNLSDLPKLCEDSFLLQYGIKQILTLHERSDKVPMKTCTSRTLFYLSKTQNDKIIATMERLGIIDM
jgi:hypothetical protein